MPVEFTGSLSNKTATTRRNYPSRIVLLAAIVSIILHVWIVHTWQSAPIEALPKKPQQVIEVALVTPPPVIKPPEIVQPKPKLPKPKKLEKIEKPKVKPIPKPVVKPVQKSTPKPAMKSKSTPLPKPVATKPVVKATPKPVQKTAMPTTKPVDSKAPPKVLQKTFTQTTPNIENNSKAKITAPVFTPSRQQTGFNTHPHTPFNTKSNAVTQSAAKANSAKIGNGSQGNADKGSSGVVALAKTKPKYPRRALERHVEGRVTIEFTVTANGTVENATVINATPSDIFNEAALTAIRQYKFKPKMINGVAVRQDRTHQTIIFKLD